MESILVTDPTNNSIETLTYLNVSDNYKQVLIEPNGDIYVNGKKRKNNKLIVETLKQIVYELNLQSSK